MEIAVIAGTYFDTTLGVDFLKKHGYHAKAYPISNTPDEQSTLQILYPNKLKQLVIEKIKLIKKEQINNVFLYCNSLSGAVNMDELSREFNINIITPLEVYKELGKKYNTIGVLAANNQSAFAIEKIIQKSNPSAYVIGIGLLPLVNAIENKMPSQRIIETFGIEKIIELFTMLKCEVFILGCTHFPYFYREIKAVSKIPIIDPALHMLLKIKTD